MAGGPNFLLYGDNLRMLREEVDDESVDLVYLDPPFNSNRTYNVLFRGRSGDEAQAQIEAFDDTWTWSQQSEEQYDELIGGGAPPRVAEAVEAMRKLLGDNDVLAYLVMMAARLVELHRVLTPTGSLYLHCDPTASHYLKLLLDATFGPTNFVNEIIWKRTSAHNRTVRFGPIHDVILFYAKGPNWYWQEQHVPYEKSYLDDFYRHVEEGTRRRYRLSDVTSNKPGGKYLWKGEPPPGKRFWGYSEETMLRFEQEGRLVYSEKLGIPSYKRYLDEMPGQLLQDVWTDISPVGSRSSERLGYPTQKPVSLLDRIVTASCPPDGIVLDPFCGCGTTIDAAQRLGRRWVGIDVTFLAIDLIENRLRGTYGEDIRAAYVVKGIPQDLEGARSLFEANPFDFERWAVSLVEGQPNERQVGDKGTDGIVRFPLDKKATGSALVSVKGGAHVNPGMVQALVGAVDQHRAQMGLFICLTPPTRGMDEVARKSGMFEWPFAARRFPRVQILTIDELLSGKKPDMPTPYQPYLQARRLVPEDPQLPLE